MDSCSPSVGSIRAAMQARPSSTVNRLGPPAAGRLSATHTHTLTFNPHLPPEPPRDVAVTPAERRGPPSFTCLKCGLFEELAVRARLLRPALLVLRAGPGGVLRGRGPQRGRHLFTPQGFPLALLRHLKPELVVHPIMAGPQVPVPDDSERQALQAAFPKRSPFPEQEDGRGTHMSTQQWGLTAPVASTTVYLLGAVHSTERRRG